MSAPTDKPERHEPKSPGAQQLASALKLAASLAAIVISILLMVFGEAMITAHASITTHLAGIVPLLTGFVGFQLAVRVAMRAVRSLRGPP